jgi:hypothetical protein
MPVTGTSLAVNFSGYPNGAPAGWTSVINSGTTAGLLGTLTVSSGEGQFTGLGVNDQGAATLNDSAGATLSRVLVSFRFSMLRPGFTERGAGTCMMFSGNPAAANGFAGYRATTNIAVNTGSVTVSYQAYQANGTVRLNDSASLGTFTGLTASTVMWMETQVLKDPSDLQNRNRFRARMWKDGDAVPAWAVDVLVDVNMLGVTGPSGVASRSTVARYKTVTIDGNWPVYPTPPNITAPVGPEVSRGTQTLTWTAGADADAEIGDVLTYAGQQRINGGAWTALFPAQAGLTYAWDLSSAGGGTAQARVRTIDADGLVSDWDEGPTLTVDAWATCGDPPSTAWSGCGTAPATVWTSC